MDSQKFVEAIEAGIQDKTIKKGTWYCTMVGPWPNKNHSVMLASSMGLEEQEVRDAILALDVTGSKKALATNTSNAHLYSNASTNCLIYFARPNAVKGCHKRNPKSWVAFREQPDGGVMAGKEFGAHQSDIHPTSSTGTGTDTGIVTNQSTTTDNANGVTHQSITTAHDVDGGPAKKRKAVALAGTGQPRFGDRIIIHYLGETSKVYIVGAGNKVFVLDQKYYKDGYEFDSSMDDWNYPTGDARNLQEQEQQQQQQQQQQQPPNANYQPKWEQRVEEALETISVEERETMAGLIVQKKRLEMYLNDMKSYNPPVSKDNAVLLKMNESLKLLKVRIKDLSYVMGKFWNETLSLGGTFLINPKTGRKEYFSQGGPTNPTIIGSQFSLKSSSLFFFPTYVCRLYLNHRTPNFMDLHKGMMKIRLREKWMSFRSLGFTNGMQ